MIKQQFAPAILLTAVFTLCTGIIFPVLLWGIGQLVFSHQANGSLVPSGDKFVGSELIGQNFTAPRYFHPRPSAAGSGYDPLASGGTNLGATSAKLFNGQPDDPATKDTDESFLGVSGLAKAYREENGLTPNEPLPVDAVTRSGSGLDPHISFINAQLQVPRIAKERGLKNSDVLKLVTVNTESRFLGIFGEPRINVLMLNMALDKLNGK